MPFVALEVGGECADFSWPSLSHSGTEREKPVQLSPVPTNSLPDVCTNCCQ